MAALIEKLNNRGGADVARYLDDVPEVITIQSRDVGQKDRVALAFFQLVPLQDGEFFCNRQMTLGLS